MSGRYNEPPAQLDEGVPGILPGIPAIPANPLDAIPTEADAYRFAVGRATGSGQNTMSQVEMDAATLSTPDLIGKYGRDSAARILSAVATGQQAYSADVSGGRTGENIAADTVGSVGLGVANAVGGIAALGLGLANNDAGAWAARQMQGLNQAVQENQSLPLQGRRRANAARNELDQRNNTAEFNAEGGDFVAGLRRIGRDVVDAVGNAVSDPVVLSDGIASGIGSIVAAGPIGRVSAALSGGRLGVAAGIGATEAGGSFVGTTNEALDARPGDNAAAVNAGLTAAALTAPAAVAAGRLVSSFESAPLRVGSVRAAAGNVARETVEEGIQSGSGQLAQNIALRQEVIPDRDLSEGVGEQIGTGALYGLGTAGAVQAPGLAMRALSRGTQSLIGAGREVINQRVERLDAQNEASSPVAENVVNRAVAEASETAPVAQQTINDAIDTTDATPDEKAEAVAFVDRLVTANTISPQEMDDFAELPFVGSTITDPNNRMNSIKELAIALNNAEDTSEKLQAAVALVRLQERFEESALANPAALDKLSDDSPALALVQEYSALSKSMKRVEKIRNALEAAKQLLAAKPVEPVNDTNVSTPEGQQQAQVAIAKAEIDPANVDNLDATKAVLYHATQGKIKLTANQHTALLAAVTVMEAAKATVDEAKRLGHKKPMTSVSEQIVDGDGKDSKISAVRHVQNVFQSLRSGNTKLAQSQLDRFGLFVQHLQNKVDGLNRHYRQGGDKPTFKALNPDTEVWYDSKALPNIRYNSPGGIELAQTVALEAKRLADIYNNFGGSMPGLTLKRIEPVGLVPDLQGPVAEVVQAFRSGQRVAGKPAPVKTEKPRVSVTADLRPKAVPQDTPTVLKQPATPLSAQSEANTNAVVEAAKSTAEPKQVSKPETNKTVGDSEAVTEAITTQPENQNQEEDGDIDPASIDAVYPRLIGSEPESKITNYFKKAFSLPKKVATSRLTGTGSPLATMADALVSQKKLNSFIGTENNIVLDSDAARDYTQYLKLAPRLISDMEKALESFLNKTPKTGEGAGKKLLDRWFNGTNEANRFADGKILNITENNDGKIEFNQELIEAATLAGLQWLITAPQQKSVFEAEDVAGVLGVTQDSFRNADVMVAKFNGNGMTDAAAKRSLARKIKDYWGVRSDPNMPIGYSEGIPEAVAAELLDAMINRGLLKQTKVTVTQDDLADVDSYFRELNFVEPTTKRDSEDALLRSPNIIDEAVLSDETLIERRHFGKPPKKVDQTQLHNEAVELTAQQKQMIRNEQNTPHFINPRMASLYKELGVDRIVQLLDFMKGGNKVYNVNHQASLDGMMQSTQAAFQAFTNMMLEAEQKASEQNVPIDELPSYFEYGVTRVGRLQMKGSHNAQANKFMREVMLPTKSTLNLSDRSGQDFKAFTLSLAQALGVKVHKQSLQKSQDQVLALLDGKLKPVIDALQAQLEDNGNVNNLPETILSSFKDAGLGFTFASLHAMQEYARYKNVDNKDGFTTSLYVEADGVTNGPFNAMVLLTPGEFSEQWVKNVGKGGLYFRSHSNGPTTMNEQHEAHDNVDMYEATTNALKNFYANVEAGITDPGIKANFNHVKNLMNLFIKDFKVQYDDKGNATLKLTRGLAKNPLTITIYGSGAKGIAGKVVSEIMEVIYERMTEAATIQAETPGTSLGRAMFGPNGQEQWTQFKSAYDALTTTATAFSKKRGQIVWIPAKDISKKAQGWKPESFTIDPDRFANFRSNVQSMFVNPLVDSITTTIGQPLVDSVALLRKLTQVQSLIQADMYKRLYMEKLNKAKETNPRAFSEGLSPNEQKEILVEILKVSPLVQTDTQSFFIANSNGIEMPDVKLGQSMGGKFRTDASITGPANAGVRGIPVMVIGSGDGQTIQNLSTMEGRPEGTLLIFDGVHLKLNTLFEDSTKTNQAVSSALQGNPMQSVTDAYSATIANTDLASLDQNTLNAIQKVFNPEAKNDALIEIVKSLVNSGQRQGIREARSITARHNVINKVQHNLDQMASAARPYTNEGIQLAGKTDAEIAAELTNQYRIELDRLTPKNERVATEANPPVDGASTQSGARVTRYDDLAGILARSGSKLSDGQKQVFTQLLGSERLKDYRIVSGTAEQLQAFANESGNRSLTPAELSAASTVRGITVPGDSTIYLVTPSLETMLHEMIHAATYEAVRDYYNGKGTPETKAAMQRIETLMNQFIEFDGQQDAAYSNARSAILDSYITNSNALKNVVAINEFMAWSLSNQNLINQLERTPSTLATLAKEVVKAIKQLFFGKINMPEPKQDMFSNLLFNSSILVQSLPSLSQQMEQTALYQNQRYGDDARLTAVRQDLNNKIARYFDAKTNIDNVNVDNEREAAAVTSFFASNAVMQTTFSMTPQEMATYEALVAVMSTQARIDPSSMNKAQELYQHVLKNLSVESFNDSERAYAQEKYDLIVGKTPLGEDRTNRSLLLPNFLALAITNNEFRDVLRAIPKPKSELNPERSVDATIENLGTTLMDKLSDAMAGTNKAKNVRDAIDMLAINMRDINEADRNIFEQVATPVGGVIDKANNLVIDAAQGLLGVAASKASKVSKRLADTLEVAKALTTETGTDKIAQGVVEFANSFDGWKPIRELMVDVIGRTNSNMNVYDLIKLTRSDVQQDRQQFRENLPTIIKSKFSRELTDNDWSSMFRGMAKTDLAVLIKRMGTKEALKLVSDETALNEEVSKLEAAIRNDDPQHYKLVERKAKQLANYMNTGVYGSNWLRNAESIAMLLNERTSNNRRVPSEEYIQNVDELVSLYAVQQLSTADKAALASLVQGEAEGMAFSLSYLVGQRAEETRKRGNDRTKYNYIKGYAPSLPKEGMSLVVATPAEHKELLGKSYIKVGDYKGSAAEGWTETGGYYFAPVSPRGAFSQGIMQNVRQTVSGVDANTGYLEGMTSGRITDRATVQRLTGLLGREKSNNKEFLLPVFNENGQVVAYERSIDPEQLKRLDHDTHFAKMIGVWRGRQVEEAKAHIFNERLIHALHDMYKTDMQDKKSKDQYVNLFDKNLAKTDPVLFDAVQLMTLPTRNYVRQVFGNEFMLRKDMLNDALGYRNASLGDAWTANSRWGRDKQVAFKQLTMSVFGNEAYRYLMTGEKTVQNFIKDARVVIVVKSVIVPATNFVSNLVQLVSRGVPLADIVKGIPRKTAEVRAYTQSRLREIAAEAELRASETNPLKKIKLEAEIKSIKDSYTRMSIWPLIKAGEFSSVSDAGISREDILLTEGKLNAYMEKLVSKLPGSIQTIGRYGLVTKDTALFQGLQKAVEYGDFLAKAIIYDDLTKRQKKSSEYALGRVTEEFVNYDRLPGRARGYVENIGLLWFWNFKIRSIKIAASMIRENPVHALLGSMLPMPSGIQSAGTPIEDNLVAKALDGGLMNSVGPGMAFRAYSLNPWVQLAH